MALTRGGYLLGLESLTMSAPRFPTFAQLPVTLPLWTAETDSRHRVVIGAWECLAIAGPVAMDAAIETFRSHVAELLPQPTASATAAARALLTLSAVNRQRMEGPGYVGGVYEIDWAAHVQAALVAVLSATMIAVIEQAPTSSAT